MGDDIPEGFIKGRLPKSLEGWNGCHLSEEQKYILQQKIPIYSVTFSVFSAFFLFMLVPFINL